MDGDLLTNLPLVPVRRFRRGERVLWHDRLGLCAGTICGVWPRGYTAYRDGVQPTKPKFLKEHEPKKVIGV